MVANAAEQIPDQSPRISGISIRELAAVLAPTAIQSLDFGKLTLQPLPQAMLDRVWYRSVCCTIDALESAVLTSTHVMG